VLLGHHLRQACTTPPIRDAARSRPAVAAAGGWIGTNEQTHQSTNKQTRRIAIPPDSSGVIRIVPDLSISSPAGAGSGRI